MKFFDTKNTSLIYQEVFNEVEYTDFPFAQIILRQDLPSLKMVKIEERPLDQTIQFKINVNKVGSILLFFKTEEFDRERFTSEVSALGETGSNTIADVIYKVRSVYEIAKRYNILFSLYLPKGDYIIFPDCYQTLVSDVVTFYVNSIKYKEVENGRPNKKLLDFSKLFKPKEKKKTKPVVKKENTAKPVKVSKPEKNKSSSFEFVNPLVLLSKDRFHYLFTIVSSFLIGFTLAVAIFDAYLGNMICIFFIFCCLAGMFLNCLIYRDTLVSHSIKSMHFILNIVISLIGWGISLGAYALFLSITKERPTNEPKTIMIILIQLSSIAVSVGLGFLLAFLKKKKS